MNAQELYSRHLFAVMDYTAENFPLLDVTAVLTRMLVDLRLCNAETDTGFIKYANAYVRQAADDMLESQVSSIDEVVALAHKFDKGEKPPFVSMQNPTRPEVTFIKILRGRGGQDSCVWIVPTDKLGLAQILHPTVEVRFARIANRQYAYLVKQCRRQNYNGSWTTVERDLAAIWLGTDWPIEAVDENYLNYLPENLRPYRPTHEDAVTRAVHELRPEKDTSDWKPDAPTTTASASNEGKDAYQSRPTGTYDITASRWLKGDSTLKDSAVLKDAQAAEAEFEASEELIAQVAVDIAVRQVRQSWGVKG